MQMNLRLDSSFHHWLVICHFERRTDGRGGGTSLSEKGENMIIPATMEHIGIINFATFGL